MEAPEETPEGTIWERVAKDKSARLRGEGPFARARRRLRGVRQRVGKVGQRIKQIIRPLEVLQFVAALFLNVTFAATFGFVGDTFSLPQHAWVLAKSFERWVEPFSSVRRNGKRGKEGNAGDDERTREREKEDRMGPISPAKLKEGLKNAKRWGGAFVGGMRRSFSSQEDLRRDQQRQVEYLAKEGHRFNGICDSAGAVDCFRRAVAIRPNDPDLLVCLSKSLSDQVFQEDVFHNHALARALSKEAAEISERAIAMKPIHAEAHLSLGAALGRLSMWSDNREKVELSRAIKERCEEAIRLDPKSDLAMHVLGRFEHQMAMLGRIVRLLVRAVYGGALSPGTLEGAETLFRRAIEINPERLIHRVELGKLLLDMKREDEALEQLELAVMLPREDINSEHERRDAVELLAKHWGRVVKPPTFEDPPPTPPPRQRRSFDLSLSRRSSLDEAPATPSTPFACCGDSAHNSPSDSANESP